MASECGSGYRSPAVACSCPLAVNFLRQATPAQLVELVRHRRQLGSLSRWPSLSVERLESLRDFVRARTWAELPGLRESFEELESIIRCGIRPYRGLAAGFELRDGDRMYAEQLVDFRVVLQPA